MMHRDPSSLRAVASSSSQHTAQIAIIVIIFLAIAAVILTALGAVARDVSSGFAATLRGGEFRGQMVGVVVGACVVLGLIGTAFGIDPVVAFGGGFLIGVIALPVFFS